MFVYIIIIILSLLFYTQREGFVNKTAILMYCTPNLMELWARHTLLLNRKYAKRHGYNFVLISKPYDDSVTHAWQKIPAMIELLNKGYELVMYIDTDAIFNKQEITVESISNKYPGDILFCSDEANSGGLYKINGGTVIVKNTPRTKQLLQQWWGLRKKYKEFAYEQWAISDIYQNKIPGIDNSIISVAPESEFNSVYSDVLHYSTTLEEVPDTFVLHFMSMNDETRERVFSKLTYNITSI